MMSRSAVSSTSRPVAGDTEYNDHVIRDQLVTISELQNKVSFQRKQLKKIETDMMDILAESARLEASYGSPTKPNPPSAREKEEADLQALVSALEMDRDVLLKKREAETNARNAFLREVFRAVDLLEFKVQEAAALEQRMAEAGLPTTSGAVDGLEAILEIEAEREGIVRSLQEEWALLASRMKAKDEELVFLTQKAGQEVHLAAAKKEDERLRVTELWDKDRADLLEEYERLLVVNREQKYHLNRGTTVRPVEQDKEDIWATEECRDLKLEEARLIKEVEAVRLQQKDVIAKHRDLLSSESLEQVFYSESKAQATQQIEGLKQQKQQWVEGSKKPPAALTEGPKTNVTVSPKPAAKVSSGASFKKKLSAKGSMKSTGSALAVGGRTVSSGGVKATTTAVSSGSSKRLTTTTTATVGAVQGSTATASAAGGSTAAAGSAGGGGSSEGSSTMVAFSAGGGSGRASASGASGGGSAATAGAGGATVTSGSSAMSSSAAGGENVYVIEGVTPVDDPAALQF